MNELQELRALLALVTKNGGRIEPPPQPPPKPAPGTFIIPQAEDASAMPTYSPWYATAINPDPNPTQAELDAYYAGPTPGKVPFVPGQLSYAAAPAAPAQPAAPPPLPPSPAPASGQPLVGSLQGTVNGKQVFNAGPGANDQTVTNGQVVEQNGASYTASVVSGPLGIPEITFVEN